MATGALVFVSHASADRDLTERVCAALRQPDPAGPPPCDPLVDHTDLAAGRPWPRQLHEFMARCHAGLLILTKAAVASPWVLKEATILAWRLAVGDSKFRLFVAQAPDVTEQELAANKFAPLMLGEVQRLPQFEAAAIALGVRQQLEPVALSRSPFEVFVSRLAANLAKVGDATLNQLAEQLNLEPPAWRPERELRAQYVEAIARQVLCESLGRYAGMDELVAELSEGDAPKETVSKLARMLAPWWVDAEAAGKLPTLIRRRPRRFAVMNVEGNLAFVAKMYTWRAHFLNLNACNVMTLPGGASGDLAEHYTAKICDEVRQRENRGDEYTQAEIVADLRRWTSIEYVALPPPLPPPAALATLTDRFPTLTFIASCGPRLRVEPNQPLAEWLQPEVDPDRVAQQSEAWRKTQQIIRNMP